MARTVTIGAMKYDIVADTEKFDRSLSASAAEMRKASKIIKKNETAHEKLGKEMEELNALRRKGAVDAKTYRRELARIEKEVRG